jgi:hypothetical protein
MKSSIEGSTQNYVCQVAFIAAAGKKQIELEARKILESVG